MHEKLARPEPLLTARNGLIAATLFFLLVGVYWFSYSGRPVSNDELFIFDAAESLLYRGETNLSYMLHERLNTDFSVAQYPPTPSADAEPMQIIVTVPLLALAELLPGIGLMHAVWLLNIFVCAAVGSVFFLYARALGYSEWVGVSGAALLGLGTIIWPYSKVFFREPLAMLLLFMAALCLHVWRLQGMDRSRWWWFAGFVAFFVAGLLTKEAALLSIPLYIVIAWPRRYTRFSWRQIAGLLVLVATVGIIGVLVFTLVGQFVELARSYNPLLRLQQVSGKLEFVPYALVSYLFSPGRSLFVFSPVLLLGIPGIGLLFRQRRRYETLIPILALLLFVGGYAVVRHENWFGGRSWGPRYLVPATPFLMLAVLPVLDVVLHKQPPRWVKYGTALVVVFGVWAQLNGVVLRQPAYYQELSRRGVIAWEAGTWHPWQSPMVVNPQLILQQPFDFAWVRTTNAGLWLPLSALLLICGMGGVLWGLLTGRVLVTRRVGVGAVVIGLLVMSGSLYVGLRSIYDDPAYMGEYADLRTLHGQLEAQVQPEDMIVLSNPSYRDFMMNYHRGSVPVYTLPVAPGEQPSPEQAPRITSNNPDRLLRPRRATFLNNLPEYTGRVWLVNNSGPFTGFTVRPVEWYMVRHYFPFVEIAPNQATRAIAFDVNSYAPPEQVMAWPEKLVDAQLGDVLQLLGYDIPPARVRVGPYPGPADPWRMTFRPGDVVPVSLLWQALIEPPQDYNVGLFLIGPAGTVVERHTAPQGAFRPMNEWRAGETVRDNHGLLLPDDLLPGLYEVWVKVYDWQTGAVLPVVGRDSIADGEAVLLTTVEVVAAQE